MSSCEKCGAEKFSDESHCTNCSKEGKDSSFSRIETGKNTKKQKMILFSSVASILVLGGLFYTGNAFADENRAIAEIERSFKEKDAERLYKFLDTHEESQEISEAHAEYLIEMYHSSSETKEEIDAYFNIVKSSDDLIDPQEFPWFSFASPGSKYLMFNDYKLMLESFPMYVSSNQSEVTFQVNEEYVKAEEMEEGLYYLGDYLLGDYEITGVLENDFMNVQLNMKNSHFYEAPAELNFHTDNMEISTNMEQASLFVDGADTGIVIGRDSTTVGPFLTEEELNIQAQLETEIGTLTSDVYTSFNMTLHMPISLEEKVMEEIFDFVESYVTENGKEALNPTEGEEKFLESMELYFEALEINLEDDEFTLELPVMEHWQQMVIENGKASDYQPYAETKVYTIAFASEDWQMENMQVSEEENTLGVPKTLTFDTAKEKEAAEKALAEKQKEEKKTAEQAGPHKNTLSDAEKQAYINDSDVMQYIPSEFYEDAYIDVMYLSGRDEPEIFAAYPSGVGIAYPLVQDDGALADPYLLVLQKDDVTEKWEVASNELWELAGWIKFNGSYYLPEMEKEFPLTAERLSGSGNHGSVSLLEFTNGEIDFNMIDGAPGNAVVDKEDTSFQVSSHLGQIRYTWVNGQFVETESFIDPAAEEEFYEETMMEEVEEEFYEETLEETEEDMRRVSEMYHEDLEEILPNTSVYNTDTMLGPPSFMEETNTGTLYIYERPENIIPYIELLIEDQTIVEYRYDYMTMEGDFTAIFENNEVRYEER